MSFFALPAWQPPSGYRIPAWLRPPEGMVPGIVPVELLLAHTDTDAVLVTGLRAYPTGVDFVLTARLRPGQPDQRRRGSVREHHHFEYHDLRFELRFAEPRHVACVRVGAGHRPAPHVAPTDPAVLVLLRHEEVAVGPDVDEDQVGVGDAAPGEGLDHLRVTAQHLVAIVPLVDREVRLDPGTCSSDTTVSSVKSTSAS
jgi:hypothetical protein